MKKWVVKNEKRPAPEEARLSDLKPPGALLNMESAAQRLAQAVKRGEKILVFGDYDVDGLTGTAIVFGLLRLLGAQVEAAVPERGDGYGLSASRVGKAASEGTKVLVAVDNGTTAFEAAAECLSLHVDLLVLDHHPSDKRVASYAFVNPQFDSGYAFKGLCGAGLAMKLAWAVANAWGQTQDTREYLCSALALAAVGTVADVMPLIDENRILVKNGLAVLNSDACPPGLAAIVSICCTENVRAEDISFKIAPRLNAAGRMGEARTALALLTAKASFDTADQLAERLENLNQQRQALEREILEQVLAAAPSAMAKGLGRCVVVAGLWPLGVLGPLCSKLVEIHGRPVVLLGVDGDKAHGSCRSVPGVPLPPALEACATLLLSFGGHDMAAGLTLETRHIDAFRETFAAALPSTYPEPALEIDAEMRLEDVTRAFVDGLANLEPCGQGNPAPIFCTRGVSIVSAKAVGKTKDHLQLTVRQGSTYFDGIAFGMGGRVLEPGSKIDVAYRPVVSRWQGRESVKLEVKDVRNS